jgi:hypothetical protein
MTETPKKALAKFEKTSGALPRLAVETPASGAEGAAPEPGKPDVHSMRVPKLDQQIVWRVIEVLKSL